MFWPFAWFVAIVYCAARAIVDLRRKNYAWAAVGLFSALILGLMPEPTMTATTLVMVPRSQGQE